MALAFPAGPTAGQQYTGPDGTVYEWNGTLSVWVKVNAVQTATAGASAATGAAVIPGGAGTARPTTPATGMFRYNNDTPPAVLEFYDGATWQSVPTSSGGGLGAASLAQAAAGTSNAVANTPETSVPKDASGMAGAALLPGSSVAYGGTPATGMIRYNNSTPPAVIEYYNGSGWVTLGSGGGATAATLAEAAAGTLNTKYSSPETAVPKDASGMAGAALLPGSGAAYGGTPATGMLRYNNATPPAVLEYYNGSGWVTLGSGGGGATAATLAEAAAGTINTKYSSPETSVPKDASGMAGAALLPGSGAAYGGTPATGMIRYNNSTPPATIEYYNGSSWITLGSSSSNSGTNVQVFDNSGTWVAPAGVTRVVVSMIGGGGMGDSTNTIAGYSGGSRYNVSTTVVPGTSYTITVGARGVGVLGTGGTTSAFGLTATGGGGTSGVPGTPAVVYCNDPGLDIGGVLGGTGVLAGAGSGNGISTFAAQKGSVVIQW
jgi:hypothetical protein